MGRRVREETLKQIPAMYASGVSLQAVGRALDVSYTTVRNTVIAAGVPLRSRGSGESPIHTPSGQEQAARKLREQGWTCTPQHKTGEQLMLVLARRAKQAITIGPDITVRVVDVGGGMARLGISAPSAVPVLREELAPPAAQQLLNSDRAAAAYAVRSVRALDELAHLVAGADGQAIDSADITAILAAAGHPNFKRESGERQP